MVSCCNHGIAPHLRKSSWLQMVSPSTQIETLSPQVCGNFHAAIELVGKRWTGAIIATMLNGADRACTIREAIPGLSDRLLTERLRELEDENIVCRTVVDSRPPAVSYTLTQKGLALEPVVASITSWGENWFRSTADSA